MDLGKTAKKKPPAGGKLISYHVLSWHDNRGLARATHNAF